MGAFALPALTVGISIAWQNVHLHHSAATIMNYIINKDDVTLPHPNLSKELVCFESWADSSFLHTMSFPSLWSPNLSSSLFLCEVLLFCLYFTTVTIAINVSVITCCFPLLTLSMCGSCNGGPRFFLLAMAIACAMTLKNVFLFLCSSYRFIFF